MIKRESYMRQIRPFFNQEVIKVLTGIRRCGKSVMLQLIQEELLATEVTPEQIIHLNFESFQNAPLKNAKALYDEIIKRKQQINGKIYLFFDEIQEVIDWEQCINSLRVDIDCDIYVTGSNAKLLSGELATHLSGRYVEFEITPFSFAEFCELYRTINSDADNRECFKQYLIFGGMPYLSNLRYQPEAVHLYLNDLYTTVELKDIVKRKKIRDVDLLERIFAYMTSNIGNIFSANTVSKYLKNEKRTVGVETIFNYIKAGMDAYLFYQVKRNDLQGKKLLTVNEKYYLADHGIREAVFGGNLRDLNLILENIVYMELRRRGYRITVGKVGDKEIDFVCDKQNERIYIQVAYLLASDDTINREFGVYEAIKDNYPKLVVTLDDFDMSRNGIKHMNIRDFLLQPNWQWEAIRFS